MRTSIGNFLRRIRMGRNQRLKDMADILGVSSAFLSAVENGTKSMPESWVSKIQREYGITDSQCEEMREASLESQKIISFNLQNATPSNRELVVQFARQFDDIDDETSQLIINMLKNRRKK